VRDPTRLPRLTDRRPLGKSGLEVSPFCLGLVREPAAVRAAFEAGINFFFLTADLHWPLYEPLRRGLAELIGSAPSVRDRIVVAVVSYMTQPAFSEGPLMETLTALPELGRIDVQVAGGGLAGEIDARVERHRAQQRMGVFGAQGVGASLHHRRSAIELVNEARCDVVFVRYNTLHAGAREDVFPSLQSSPTLIYNFKSTMPHRPLEFFRTLGCLDEGVWVPSPTDHYRFALARPEIDGVLCALTNQGEVAALQRALDEEPLSPEEEEHMLALADLEKKAWRQPESSVAE
jgi:aryl-alcohol dehydrogenase-like predicted oxidoreductase